MELQVKQEGLEMRTQTTCLDAASCVLTEMQIGACELSFSGNNYEFTAHTPDNNS